MLSTIASQFKGLLRRSYWFGSFLPVALVAFLHALIFAQVFPGRLTFEKLFSIGAGELASNTVILVILLGILAYSISPLLPLFHGLLDGSLLPGWLHDRLRLDRLEQWRGKRSEFLGVMQKHVATGDLVDRCRDLIAKGREAGQDKPIGDIPAIEAARTALAEVKRLKWRDIGAHLDQVEAAAVKLAAALDKNTTDADVARAAIGSTSLEPAAAARWATSLEAIDDELRILLDDIETDSRHRFEALERREESFSLRDWQATRLGDVKLATQRYSSDAYGAEFDWLWPRLESLIDQGEESPKGLALRLDDSKSQLDFAVLLLFLLLSVPIVWIPLLAATGGHLWLILAIGWSAPLVGFALYELVIRSQMIFGALVETAIDRHRFELLDQLHQERPRSLTAERELWDRLGKINARAHRKELFYKAAGAKE